MQESRKAAEEEEERWKGNETEKFPHFSGELRAPG